MLYLKIILLPKLKIKTIKIILTVLFGISFSSTIAQQISKVDSLERVLLSQEDPHKKMDIILEMTDLILSSDPDRALELANQTVAMAIEYDDQESKLFAWLQMAEIYWNKSEFRLSMELGNKVKILAVDLDLEREYAAALILISRNLCNLGEYKKSSALSFQALKIFEKLDDKKGISKAYNRIGVEFFEQGDNGKAFDYYSQALRISKEINDLVGISRELNNIAIINRENREYEQCLDNYLEAVDINKKIGQRLWEGINYANLGSLYGAKQRFDTTLYYLNKASKIFKEQNSLTKLASTYISMSQLYSDIEKYDSSLYYANLAYKIGLDNNQTQTVYKAAQRLHHIYFSKNDILNAYNYSIIENQMKDTLDIERSMAQLLKMELRYEFDKIEQENKIKQQQREYKYITVGTSVVILLILLVIFIIARHKRKRRQLNQELQTTNKELTSNVMSIMRKNELLAVMADKLMDIQKEAVKDETKLAIANIVKELERTSDMDIWDEFEIRFKQVHGEFYKKLINQFPDLSPNEQKICAFLRLNMTSKEISELTGQSVKTLEIARTRLRKKLGMTNTKTNLVTFLSQI
jgi:tetratricopeptide (TPR) repeat protein/DNA-binding CsgD family transcriptional regulator